MRILRWAFLVLALAVGHLGLSGGTASAAALPTAGLAAPDGVSRAPLVTEARWHRGRGWHRARWHRRHYGYRRAYYRPRYYRPRYGYYRPRFYGPRVVCRVRYTAWGPRRVCFRRF